MKPSKEEIAEAKAASLNWCNERRELQGMEPLVELPKGKIADPLSCPCGKATGLYVSSMCFYEPIPDPDREGSFTSGNMIDWIPEGVGRFVSWFDRRYIPELIEE